jgi:Tfp pilus assembly protein PilV
MKTSGRGSQAATLGQARRSCEGGFSFIEIMLGMTVLVVGIIGAASMFSTAYTDVAAGGRKTMAVTAVRQILEDVRQLPFDNLANLNGYDTGSLATLPASDPERSMARKWRYTVAGEGTGWGFTTAEKAQWKQLSTGTALFGGRAQVAVVNQTATLRLVTVTVQGPGRGATVQIATLVSRL